jgi:hypothetical protein
MELATLPPTTATALPDVVPSAATPTPEPSPVALVTLTPLPDELPLLVRTEAESVVFELERPADQTGTTERTYQAVLTSQRAEPLALRAFICPGTDRPFTPRQAELLAAPEESGGLVVLQDDGCARVQGILWEAGEQFRWELRGNVDGAGADAWLTELVVYASYRTSEPKNEWEPLLLPILEHYDRLGS